MRIETNSHAVLHALRESGFHKVNGVPFRFVEDRAISDTLDDAVGLTFKLDGYWPVQPSYPYARTDWPDAAQAAPSEADMAQLDALQAKLEGAERRATETATELSTLKAKYESLLGSSTASDQKLQTLQTSYDDLKTRYDELQGKYDALLAQGSPAEVQAIPATPEAQAEPAKALPTLTADDLAGLGYDDLKAQATQRGLSYPGNIAKTALVELILGSQK